MINVFICLVCLNVSFQLIQRVLECTHYCSALAHRHFWCLHRIIFWPTLFENILLSQKGAHFTRNWENFDEMSFPFPCLNTITEISCVDGIFSYASARLSTKPGIFMQIKKSCPAICTFHILNNSAYKLEEVYLGSKSGSGYMFAKEMTWKIVLSNIFLLLIYLISISHQHFGLL